MAWSAVAGATQYTITATRSGSPAVEATLSAEEYAALTGGRYTLSNVGRGAWSLKVLASNAYTAPTGVTSATSTSFASVSVTVGLPDEPTLGTVTGAEGKLTLTFRWAALCELLGVGAGMVGVGCARLGGWLRRMLSTCAACLGAWPLVPALLQHGQRRPERRDWRHLQGGGVQHGAAPGGGG